jgi:hypothetical protein
MFHGATTTPIARIETEVKTHLSPVSLGEVPKSNGFPERSKCPLPSGLSGRPRSIDLRTSARKRTIG